jgi:hypothetical protein
MVEFRVNGFSMTRSGRGRGSDYAETTKRQIIRAVQSQPGRTGGQIAQSLGLDRSRVNSFLYGEGKRRFGLLNSNWRWYPGGEALPPDSVKPGTGTDQGDSGSEARLTDSVCAVLSKMSVTTATLKIRSMSLHLVELAFAEDEYPVLDDRLKAELIMRKKSLEATPREVQIVKQEPSRWFWALVVVVGVWMLSLLGNQQPANYETEPRQDGGTERALPGQ